MMIGHTTEEANEMWCPNHRSFRTYGNHVTAVNNGSNCNCISDNCMMWRWLPGDTQSHHNSIIKMSPNRGYCGLATKPEV